jgi:hypothetical protein
MRDEVQEFSPDVSTQKAVTDWLMQVISGKKPIELNINDSPRDAESVESVEAAPAISHSIAAVEEEPLSSVTMTDVFGHEARPEVAAARPDVFDVFGIGEPAPVIEPPVEPVQAAALNFSIEDLFGPPAIPYPAEMLQPVEPPKPAEPAFTAEDLCGAPVFQMPVVESNGHSAHNGHSGAEFAFSNPEIWGEADPAESNMATDFMPVSGTESHSNGFRMEDLIREAEESQNGHLLENGSTPHSFDAEAFAGRSDVFGNDFGSEVLPETASEVPEWSSIGGDEIQGSEAVDENVFGGEKVFAQENVWARGDIWGDAPGAVDSRTGAAETLHAAPVFEAPSTHNLADAAAEKVIPNLDALPGEDLFSEEGPFLSIEELRKMVKEQPETVGATWKTLLRFGSVLPWLSRTLPVFEAGARAEQSTGFLQEVRHEVSDLRGGQVELRTALQENSAQLKKMDEQLTRIRTTIDHRDGEDLSEMVRSTAKWLRIGGIGFGVVLVTLIVMVAMVMAGK